MAATVRQDNDAVALLQRQCIRELTSLREQLDESEDQKALLSRKVRELTAHLTETTQEVAQRSSLFHDTAERADRLETLVSDAKKTLLTREMRIHELTQQVQTLETTLRTEQAAKDHWEREFVAAKDEVVRVERKVTQLSEQLRDRTAEVAGWKTKLKLAMASLRDLQDQLSTKTARETQLVDEITRLKAAHSERERKWKAKDEKHATALLAFQQQLQTMQDAQASVDARARAISEREAQSQASDAAQQLDRRRQLLSLQDALQHTNGELDKAKMHELLSQRELCRLREELLLSESQRKTEQRRHAQQLKGKEKEMAFVWQKYVDAMASRGAVAGQIHTMR